ncbi:conjugative transfer protein MobI(A/C), partial [Escherichia coli]|uniref:conjugative transfer protein MobI(A/C) n=1 Tax=Escherichia coli TaxID=562 RepID=UPI003C30E708
GCNPTSSKFIHTWLRFGEIMRGSLSTWHQFSPYKNRPPSHMSKRISPMKSGKYTKSCFVNHASWEYEMIEKTEGLLEPYRELLEFYHAAYIELGRKVRQYSKSEVAQ